MSEPDELTAILQGWGVVPASMTPLGTTGTTWRIERDNRSPVVLKQFEQGEDTGTVAYRRAVIEHLAGHGWPVPLPLEDVAWAGGRGYVLLPLLAGSACRAGDPVDGRRRGRLLAGMHGELARLAESPAGALGQRPGWLAVDQFLDRHEWDAELTDLVDEIGDRLAAYGSGQFPVVVNHGDLTAGHVLVRRDDVTGVLGFHRTHLDLRAADVAAAMDSDHDAAAAELVAGYVEVSPLSEAELAVLPDLRRAALLRRQAAAGGTAAGGAAAAG